MTIQEKVDYLSKAAAGCILLFGVAFALIYFVYERIKSHPLQSYFDTLERERRDNFYHRAKERRAEQKEMLDQIRTVTGNYNVEPPTAKFQIGQPVLVDNKQGKLLELTIIGRSYYPPKSMWFYRFEGTTTGYGEDLIQMSPNYMKTCGRHGDVWLSRSSV